MKIVLIVIIIILAFALALFVLWESVGFCVTSYDIVTEKKLDRDYKLVFLSDLHDTDTDCCFDRNKVDEYSRGEHKGHNKRLLNAIDVIDPDFVLLGGDMITSYMQPSYNSDITFEFIKELSLKHKVYFGIGNHEQRYLEDEMFDGKYDELKKFVTGLNIPFLENRGEFPEGSNIGIYGLLIPMLYYRRVVPKHLPEGFVRDSLGQADDSRFNILLAHTPDHFDDYADWNPDLVLSGHVHGGIIGVPGIGGLISPQLRLFPKYDAGLFENGKSRMLLSRGIGWHTIPLRIFNRAEVIVINIKNK